MMASSHISFAATLWWLYCLMMGYSITGFHTLVAAMGGLMPDLDHPKSVLGRRLPFIRTLCIKWTENNAARIIIIICCLSAEL